MPRLRRTLAAALGAAIIAITAGAGAASAARSGDPLLACRSHGDACHQPGEQRAYVLPEPDGTMTTAQFIAAAVPAARLSRVEHRVPVSVTIAQAILESGWGRSALSTV